MYNREKLVGIILTGLILINVTGCKKDDGKITESVKESISNNIDNNTVKDNVDKKDSNDSSLLVPSINQSLSNETTANINSTVDETLSKDEIIVNYFNEATDDINNLLSSDNIANAKVKCKEYFITFVDFIFYGGKIKDITFSELKEGTKETVIAIVQKLDNFIMKKFPNYKETISDKSKYLYDKASELLHSGKDSINDYIETQVGDENYQKILDEINDIKERDKETWNNMKDFGSDVYETGKDKVKTWYENFKNK